MKNKYVGPKKITRSVLEKDEKPKKKKKKEEDLEFLVKKVKVKAEPVDDDDDDIVLPKKGSKKKEKKIAKMSAQLALIGDVTPRQVQRTMVANFGEAADKVINMLEMNDNDGAMVLLQKRLLQSSVAMLTLAEKAMSDSEGQKGTYQYATLVSQIRELITDIQAGRDRSFIANSIIDQTIRPAFIDIAEFILGDHQEFRREMQDAGVVDKDKSLQFNTALRDLAKGLAGKMQHKYKDLSFKITQQLTS